MLNAVPPNKNPYSVHNRDTIFEGQLWKEGLNAFYRDDDDTALGLFLEVLEANRQNLRCAFLAMLCAANLNDEDTLEEIWGSVRNKDSRHPYVVGCQAVRLMFYANYERAEHLFKRAIGARPQDIDLNIGLGILYDQTGQERRSAEVYRRVLKLAPQNIRARICLGTSYALSGEYRSAFAEYQYAKRLDPSVENPHQHLGRDFYADGMLAEAVQEFLQAITEEPRQPAAYFFLMDCYKRLGQIDDAIDIYQQTKQRFGNEPEILAQFYEQFRMYREALPLLEQLYAQNPGDLEIGLRLTQAYRETGNIPAAIALLKSELRNLPDAGPIWLELARLYYQAQEYGEAVAAAKQVLLFNQDNQEAYAVLANALLFMGKIEEAEAAAQTMERIQDEAWQRYQRRFSGRDEETEN